MTNLIYGRIWEYLNSGAGPGRSPLTLMQAATVGLDGSPQVRTIVLRKANEASSSISFVSDARSPKVAELIRDPRISLVGYDPEANVQIRLNGQALIQAKGPETRAAWNTFQDHTLMLFRKPLAAGTPIQFPAEGHVKSTGEPPQGHDGYENLALIEVSLTCLEWLDVSGQDHERVVYRRSEGHWAGSWIAP
jgi:pyridoxamine 5'-phosphate oxidase